MNGKAAWILALAACGRLGFQQAGPDADVTDAIRVVVTSDEYLAEPAGAPIAGATVLIERGGAVDRAMTDDTGAVTFAPDGVTAYHVIYQGDIGWRIYTVTSPRIGTIELGGRSAFNLNRSMTLSMPGTGGGSDSFTAHLPDRCAVLPLFASPSFTFDFNPDCEGQSIRLIAFRLTAGSEYIDAGTIALANGTTHTVTGSFLPVPSRSIELVRLPGGTLTVYADIVARAGIDFTRLSPDRVAIATMGATGGTIVTSAPPGGDAIHVQAWNEMSLGYASISERIQPATIEDNTVFDGVDMLPLFGSLTVEGIAKVSWTGGGTAGTLIAVEATGGMLQWNAYVDPAATAVRFPAIPADLAVPMPAGFAVVSATKLDVPGMTAADLARTFDRTWVRWPNVDVLMPPSGSSRTRIQYIPGL